ncbi:hypothetical protein V1478_013111 [Vespula squamosa]|uniref:Uncharacterized protein n=1 Tax=Vespula squamosa TaxID=30214 RepID=A0ABD2AAH5_VESSQ
MAHCTMGPTGERDTKWMSSRAYGNRRDIEVHGTSLYRVTNGVAINLGGKGDAPLDEKVPNAKQTFEGRVSSNASENTYRDSPGGGNVPLRFSMMRCAKNHDEKDLLEVKVILQLKVILLIIKTVLTHHHQGNIKAIIAGLMVSPVTQPPPQLTMKYLEVYNGSAISRNTRGLYRSHNIEQTHSLTKNGVIHQNTRQMRDFEDSTDLPAYNL